MRGACSLRPGVPGLSANIKVRSVVGRFLEHSKIFYFRNKLKHDIYLSSADWMGRNLLHRMDVAFPVTSPALKTRVLREGLQPYLKDAQEVLKNRLGAGASGGGTQPGQDGSDRMAPRRPQRRRT